MIPTINQDGIVIQHIGEQNGMLRFLFRWMDIGADGCAAPRQHTQNFVSSLGARQWATIKARDMIRANPVT